MIKFARAFVEIWQLIKAFLKQVLTAKIEVAEDKSVETGSQLESEKYISSDVGKPAEFSDGVLTLPPEEAAKFESGRMDSKNDSNRGEKEQDSGVSVISEERVE